MDLGAFSVSLTVKDLEVSEAFYAKLGFEIVGGEAQYGYLILRNGRTTLGLFQGMFDKNVLTFNPGWDDLGHEVDGDFTDVRDIAASLEDQGVELTTRELPDDGGPGHVALLDPDGNPVLIDQHR